MTPSRLTAQEARTLAPLHSMAVDTLSVLPFHDRIVAYDDFDDARQNRRLAHWYRRNKTLGWRGDFHLQMRRAIRAWRHYADAVRKAENMRIAA